VPSYLSDEWLAALDAAARNHAGLAAATAGVHLVLEQVVTCRDGVWSIVDGLELNDFSRQRIDATVAELGEERTSVAELGLLG